MWYPSKLLAMTSTFIPSSFFSDHIEKIIWMNILFFLNALRNYFPKRPSVAPLYTLSNVNDVPVGFVTRSHFEDVYCFNCDRRRKAVARYRMICLVLVHCIYISIKINKYLFHWPDCEEILANALMLSICTSASLTSTFWFTFAFPIIFLSLSPSYMDILK